LSQVPLLLRVREALEKRCGISPGQRLLLAVSGGSDSIAMLHLLLELVPKIHLELEVGHFDHRLQKSSTGDREFVERLAKEHGVPTHVGEWADPTPSEEAARTARYAFLLGVAEERQCAAVVLGHHLEDRLETLFLRLGRGSGLRGLAGLRWRRPDRVAIVRPLLGCQHAELEGWLEDRALPWRHDPSNDDLRFARNRLRHVMLPALEDLGPGWRKRAQESLEDLGAAWDWMQAQASEVASRTDTSGALGRDDLKELPDLLLRTVLQSWLEDRGIKNLRREHLEEVAHLARNGHNGQMSMLPGAVRCHVEANRLVLAIAQVPETT